MSISEQLIADVIEELQRRKASKAGKAASLKMTPEQKSARGKKAASARWTKHKEAKANG